MEMRKAVFNAWGTINCEIHHPGLGWVPFTASPDDRRAIGRDIFAALADRAAEYVEPAPDIEGLAAEVRANREVLLAASDWTQMADAPVDRAAWVEYRQALRDVPLQPGFPVNVSWPHPPGGR